MIYHKPLLKTNSLITSPWAVCKFWNSGSTSELLIIEFYGYTEIANGTAKYNSHEIRLTSSKVLR